MSRCERIVYLIDDDFRIRESLAELLVSHGIPVMCFEYAQDYLRYSRSDTESCLILDLQLPGISGLELQQQLSDELAPPIVFISGYVDMRCAVRAMKAGAFEFLSKPVDPVALVATVEAGLARDRYLRARSAALHSLRRRFDHLTPREQQVFPLLTSGLRNKQSAWTLGISEVTLQAHRGRIMRKMAARSFADLVRMGEALSVRSARGELSGSSGSLILPTPQKGQPETTNRSVP